MWQLTTAAVQMCSTDDLDRNLAVCRERVGEAVAGGARLVILPECFAFLGRKEGDKLGIAEVLDVAKPGKILGTLIDLATRHGIWLIGGGLPERVPGDDRRTYNTAAVIAPDGTIAAAYRKVHLFDVDIPGGAVLRESDATCAGTDRVVVDIDGAKVG